MYLRCYLLRTDIKVVATTGLVYVRIVGYCLGIFTVDDEREGVALRVIVCRTDVYPNSDPRFTHHIFGRAVLVAQMSI